MSAPAPCRAIITETAVPRLAPHIRLSFDRRRERWVMLGPERLLLPDETAVEVLRRCDGLSNIAAIVDALAAEFDAPREDIARDVVDLVQSMTDQGVLAA